MQRERNATAHPPEGAKASQCTPGWFAQWRRIMQDDQLARSPAALRMRAAMLRIARAHW